MSEVRLSVEPRTEFGKGAARRTRRAGKIPAVLYGHGTDPRHLALPALEFARVIRENGSNAVLTLNVENATELALTKTITVHPLKNYIEHVDLLVVKRGEKIAVDVPIVLTGDPVPGTLVRQELDTISVEVEALHIPEQFEVSVAGAEAGTQILASQVSLPSGATLLTDPETLVTAVTEATQVAEEGEAEAGAEAAAE
ncbi:50S ribosomal protein L25/general stress protein Ctc [Amycolatopsis rhizosphaerae]|uniref:Large ribosomal subunit protein bL25 n=1 Tax=Amycolatopsis rhizosphaerae TaxID=2053003 RepID=A0A558ACK0_9PSEU|nr:50S ribosomal protein L25/general stress protein Ctc [Amycolatopsis rhizosphaerae]TVT21999.1 50S ribosomal protein L25/general stress protein Ctc [Amycolatopsis rhizosphaerae]